MIVKAAVARNPRSLLAVEVLDLDDPRGDEVLVRLVASGVGPADLEAIEGVAGFPFPFVGGGEGAGIVERVGSDVRAIAPGDTVVLTIAFCGRCSECLSGAPGSCRERQALNRVGKRRDGSMPLTGGGLPIHGFFEGQSSFATHALCRSANVVKVPADAPLEVLACLGGAFWTAAAALIHGFSPKPDDAVVIVGAGGLGLVAAMSARALGVRQIIIADPDGGRRALASELGATLTVHTDEDLGAVVKSVTGCGARFALDTVGDPSGLAVCLDALASTGTCGLLRSPNFEAPLDVATARPRTVAMERGCGSPHDVISQMAAWHAAGRFPIERLVAFFPFEHINDAVQALATHAVIKPIVRFSLGPFADLDRAAGAGAAADAPVSGEDDSAGSEPAVVLTPG